MGDPNAPWFQRVPLGLLEVLVLGWLRFVVFRFIEAGEFATSFWRKLDTWFTAGCCLSCEADEYADLARESNWAGVETIDEGAAQILAAKLVAAVELIKHEDALNWHKFYNFVYVNLSLAAGYGFVLLNESHLSLLQRASLLIGVNVLGGLATLGFLLTLWSGMSCLRGHKEAVLAIDRAIAGIEHCVRRGGLRLSSAAPGSVFLGKEGPTRIMLRLGPFLALVVWGIVGYVTYDTLTQAPKLSPEDPFYQQATSLLEAVSNWIGVGPEAADPESSGAARE
ncbi:MAG: hypothetical protein AAGH99_16330 [Planctomycetota bacterium]